MFKELKFDDIDIPEDFEEGTFFSSNAKTAKKEIKEFLETANEEDKIFHELKERIYQGDMITKEKLAEFSQNNKINSKKLVLKKCLHIRTLLDNRSSTCRWTRSTHQQYNQLLTWILDLNSLTSWTTSG